MAAAALFLICACGCEAADDSTWAPISTDRPSVTSSSVAVPVGSFQMESGFTDTVIHGERTLDGPESFLRFGLGPKTELRVTTPIYFDAMGASRGFGDTAIAVLEQLGPVRGFDVAVILSLSFPSGAREWSSHGYDPFVQVPWSRGVSKNWTAAGMFSVYWPTEAGRRNTTGETTFQMDRQLTSRWDAFVEYAGDFPQAGGPSHLMHFGTEVRVTRNQQIDLHGGFGLSSAAVDHFWGVGYSFRVPMFARGK